MLMVFALCIPILGALIQMGKISSTDRVVTSLCVRSNERHHYALVDTRDWKTIRWA